MGEDSAELNKHVSVSKDQDANSDSNPIFTKQEAAQHAAILAALEDIDINVDSMDINLADVETLITATNAALASLEAANDISGDDIVTAVDSAKTTLDATLIALQASNETHSDEEQAAIASLEAAVAAFNTAFDNRDLATETTLDALKTQHLAESDETQGLIGEVSATPTANTVLARLKDIYESVDDLELSIDNIDVDMDDVEALLTTIDAVLDDTLLSIGDETDAEATGDGSAIAILKRLRTRLDQLITDFNAEDFASETTLAAFASANATNLNDIEADVEAFKAAFDARDLATETKQDDILTKMSDASQLSGVLGEDGATIAGHDNPLPVAESGADPLDSANSTKTPLSPGAFTAFTVDDATDVFTSAAHGLSDGDPIVVKSDDTLPAGMVEDLVYYVSDSTTNTFKLKTAAPFNTLAAYLDVTDAGTGTHSWAVPGEFLGPFTRLNRATDLFMFAFADTPFGSFEVEWSSDGVSTNTDALPVSNIKTSENLDTPGFALYLDTLTTDVDNYYRVRVRSGSSAAALSDVRTWTYPGGFHGTYLGLSDALSNLSTALLTRAVLSGNLLDEDNEDSGTFANALLSNKGALTVADIPDQIARGTSEDSGSLPSGATPAFDAVGPIVAANVIDTGWLNISQWDYQFFHSVFEIPGIKIFVMDAEDDQGNGSITTSFAFPTRTTKGFGSSDDVGAPAFNKWFRLVIINDTGTACNDWNYRSVGLNHAIGPVFQSLDSEIFDFYPAPITQNIVKGRNAQGLYKAVRTSDTDGLVVRDERLHTTQSGSLFTEGITSHVSHIFSRDKGVESIERMVKVSAAGTMTHDATEGRAVVATSATNGEVAYFETQKTLRYDEAAHMMRYELTGEIPQWPLVGDEEILVGPMEDDGSEGILNGIVHGFDATGYFVTRYKLGSEVAGVRTYSDSFNRNPLIADDRNNLFRKDGVGQAIDPTQNNYLLGYFEWLGIAPPTYGNQAPSGDPLVTHIEETPNNISGTILQEPNIPIGIRIKNDSTSGRVLEYHVGSIRGGTHESKVVNTARDPNDDFTDVRSPGIDAGNTTETPLNGDTGGSDHIWRGTWIASQGPYIGISAEISADVPGTLHFDHYLGDNPVDGDDSSLAGGDSFTITRPYTPTSGEGIYRATFPTQSRWVRVRFVNGATAQSFFNVTTAFITTPVPDETEILTIAPVDSSLAGIERVIDFAKDAVDGDYDQVYRTGNSRNTHLTGSEARLHIGGIENVQPAASFVVSAEESTEIYSNLGTVPQAVKVANSGAFHAFVNPNAAATVNDDPHFLGGSSFWLLNPGETLEAICEDTGGASNIVNLESAGNTAGGTATSPDNAKVSNNSRAIRNAVGETLTMEGFSHTLTAGYAYDRVRIHHEARKSLTPATETAVFEQAGWGEVASAASVTTLNDDLNATGSMDGGTDQLYVAFVTRNALNVVSAVSGPGGESFQAIEQNVQGGGRRIDAWYYYGDISAGAVTASMSTTTAAQIAVHRISNANSSTPIEGNGPNTGTGVTASGPTLAKTNLGIGLLGVSHEAASATPGAGYTERSDESIGTGSNTVSLASESKPFVSTGSEAASMTLLSSTDWLAIGVTILPANTVNPVETLSFEYDSVPGSITAERTWANTSDADQYFDITGDLDIETFDPSLLKVISTVDTIGSADFESDVLEIEIRETTGASTRLVVISGDIVPEGA